MKSIARNIHFLIFGTLMLGVGLLSCEESASVAPPDIIFPESNISFYGHVLPLFDESCAYSGCHNDYDMAGGLSLSSYYQLFREPGLVLPGDSASSVLGQILRGTLPHQGYPISQLANMNQRHGVNVWIQEGARNN